MEKHQRAAGADGKLLIADADGDPSWTTVSGDATLSAGAITIANDAITPKKTNKKVQNDLYEKQIDNDFYEGLDYDDQMIPTAEY